MATRAGKPPTFTTRLIGAVGAAGVREDAEHLALMGNDVYGGTHRLVSRVFVPWGVSISSTRASLVGGTLELLAPVELSGRERESW